MIKQSKITLFWFRNDLRITDNPGLFHAADNGSVMPIYILDDIYSGNYKMGTASRWWLYNSLKDLNLSLDNALNIYSGDPLVIIADLVERYNISAVYFNRCYEPWSIKIELLLQAYLKEKNIECVSFNASLLWEPWDILKKDRTPYKVFTPYFRNGCLSAPTPRKPIGKPARLSCVYDPDKTLLLPLLLKQSEESQELAHYWEIGEQAAYKKLRLFIKNNITGYTKNRDFPGISGTSRLSPYLHYGEISPHQVWHYTIKNSKGEDTQTFLKQLGWREFSYYLLYHFPELPYKNFQEKFNTFAWHKNVRLLRAWQTGQTGYPIIDAGMRELQMTGYMHNRVRMIVASFLVKNLLIDWREGADWFWDHLVDADLANNSASWQWVAGCGADAAPYFRIFNPVTQGEKFDKQGDYTKKFVPELAKLPAKYLFKPWTAPQDVLISSGVILGDTYPLPIVDLKKSRNYALKAYYNLKKT